MKVKTKAAVVRAPKILRRRGSKVQRAAAELDGMPSEVFDRLTGPAQHASLHSATSDLSTSSAAHHRRAGHGINGTT
jgi:hypothetical protein